MNYEDYVWEGITYGGSYIKALFDYVKEHPFKDGLEVGFDQGASAMAFLRACPDAHLTSIDIYPCEEGKARLTNAGDLWKRLNFVEADSRERLPALAGLSYDMIYIDGDHLYDAVKQDLYNAHKLLAEGGYMIVDDANPNHSHFGVGRAVAEMCAELGYQKWDLVGSPSEAVVLKHV